MTQTTTGWGYCRQLNSQVNLMRQALAGDISFSSPPGTLVGSGQATMGPSPALTNQVAGVSIMFSLFVKPDGTPAGNATITSIKGSVDFKITSLLLSTDGTLSAAGPATAVYGTPGFGPDSEGPAPNVVKVGETMFFNYKDNGTRPDQFIEGKVPPNNMLPPGKTQADFDTIQKINGFLGNPTDAQYRTAIGGDLIKFPHRKATATALLTNGIVTEIQVADPGFGYQTAPTVLITGGAAAGATPIVAAATVSNGVVTGINIISGGVGYTTAPTVLIASVPFAPSLSIGVSKVRVTFNVVLGLKYQLESSFDLKTWAAAGGSFVAQGELLSQEFDVDTTGRYFRINQVP